MKNDAIEIKPASQRHVYTLSVMTKAFFPYVNFASDEINRRLSSHNVKYFIAEQNGTTIGFADFEITPENTCKLMGLAVLAEHRRKGIARKLVQRILNEVKRFGCSAIFLLVAQDNQAAISLYNSFGFMIKGNSDRVLAGKPIIVMELTLANSVNPQNNLNLSPNLPTLPTGSSLPSHLNSAG